MPATLLVCSGGGHLKQLFTLAGRMGIHPDDQYWMTFDNGLSRVLLADREVQYVPFAGPRDGHHISSIAVAASAVFRHRRFDMALSTGSGPAVAVLPQAAAHGIAAHYIESAARADGPSLSGRLVSKLPWIHTYTQYPAWMTRRWHYRGSIFDAFAPGPIRAGSSSGKVVVSVGTQDGYPFRRLFDALVPLLAPYEVLWQTGTTDVSHLGIDGRHSVQHDELRGAIAEADVVISHAGCGGALTAIEAGKAPILVPRLARHREHVDDHQLQIAAELHRRGLALMSHVEALDEALLLEAASRSAVRVEAPPYLLDGTTGHGQDHDGDLLTAGA